MSPAPQQVTDSSSSSSSPSMGASACVEVSSSFAESEARQRSLALDDPERTGAPLFADELAERARFTDVRGDVRRNRAGCLASLDQADRELRLLDRGDDALRLRR